MLAHPQTKIGGLPHVYTPHGTAFDPSTELERLIQELERSQDT
jgi:hypothetical protein